jgi:DNA replication initiation complex subunit (GINS family)
MSLLAKLRSFLRNLFSSQSVDADLDREVHSHLSMLIDENTRAGMPPDEAQRAAHKELGGIEQVKEQVREKRIGNWLHSAFSDCHYGVRTARMPTSSHFLAHNQSLAAFSLPKKINPDTP